MVCNEFEEDYKIGMIKASPAYIVNYAEYIEEYNFLKEYNHGYYEAIYKAISKYKNYSVLGYLDMIKRYDECGILKDEVNEDIINYKKLSVK